MASLRIRHLINTGPTFEDELIENHVFHDTSAKCITPKCGGTYKTNRSGFCEDCRSQECTECGRKIITTKFQTRKVTVCKRCK